MTIVFDTSYLNKTPNKTPRQAGLKRRFRIWHETGGNREHPQGTLVYNLDPAVASSYDVLIAWNGTIYQYIDSTLYTAWGAGQSRLMLHGVPYINWLNNLYGYNIEIDGPDIPGEIGASDAQLDAAARFALYTEQTDGIPIDGSCDFTHKQIAPGRKHDPEGYTVDQVLSRARAIKLGTPQPVPPPTSTMVYLKTTAAANLRQGPARSFPVVRLLPVGDVAGYDGDTIGESIAGNNVWKHYATGEGFVHSSLLVPA